MPTEISEEVENIKKELFVLTEATNKVTDLNLKLQKIVKEVKDDTLLNAQHINVLKNSSVDAMDKTHSILNKHITESNILVEGLEEEYEHKSENNYSKFIKSLLESDFKAIQNELVEDVRRQFTKNKGKPQASTKQGSSKINIVFNIMSLISFVFLIYLCFKYNLLK